MDVSTCPSLLTHCFLMAGLWLGTKLLEKTTHFLEFITYLTSTNQQVWLFENRVFYSVILTFLACCHQVNIAGYLAYLCIIASDAFVPAPLFRLQSAIWMKRAGCRVDRGLSDHEGVRCGRGVPFPCWRGLPLPCGKGVPRPLPTNPLPWGEGVSLPTRGRTWPQRLFFLIFK